MKVTCATLVKAAIGAVKKLANSNAADKAKAGGLGQLAARMQEHAMELHRRADDAANPEKAKLLLGTARFYCEKAADAFKNAAAAM